MIYNNQIATIYPTDVGYLVSKVIAESTEYKKLSLKIAKTLDAIFLDSIIEHSKKRFYMYFTPILIIPRKKGIK